MEDDEEGLMAAFDVMALTSLHAVEQNDLYEFLTEHMVYPSKRARKSRDAKPAILMAAD